MGFQAKSFLLSTFLFLGVLLCNNSVTAQHNNFKYFSIEQGLSQSDVFSVKQDSNGYLWIGTGGGGLNRFDGKAFTAFTKKDGLSGNTVRCLIEDHNNNLWIGTEGGVTVYDGYSFHTILSDSNDFSGSTSISLFQSSDNIVWVGTDDGGINKIECEWNKENGQFKRVKKIIPITTNDGLGSNTIFDIYEDKFKRLWLAAYGGGISILDLKKVTEGIPEILILNDLTGLHTNDILCIENDRNGSLWIGTLGAGIFKIPVAEEITTRDMTGYSPMLGGGFSGKTIWDIHSASNGELWFASWEDGVMRLPAKHLRKPDNEFLTYGKTSGMVSNQFLSIEEDHEGNIWLGSNGDGLCQYTGDHFSHYNIADGFSNNKIQGIAQDQSGSYWLASNGGGLIKFNIIEGVNIIKNHGADDGLQSDFLSAVAIGKKNDLWIATVNQGIIYFDGNEFTQFTQEHGLLSNRVYSIYVDSDGIVWCGTSSGISMYDGLSEFGEIQFVNRTTADMGMENEGVNAIIEDSNNVIWFATADGLAKYDKAGTMQTFDHEEGLYDRYINTLTEGPNGNIWMGTTAGIYVLDVMSEDSLPIRHFADGNVLISNAINSIGFANDSTLIAGTDKGFDKIIINKKGELVAIRSYDATDGFIGVECNDNALFKDIDDNIWIGTGKGVTRYTTAKEITQTQPPTTHITEVRLQFETVDWSEKGFQTTPWFMLPDDLILSHKDNHLTFYFNGLSFSNSEKVKYRYKMEGLDINWSPASSENKVTYSGLDYGEYTFKIMSTNANGQWNEEPTSFHFVILPPWYKTTWFYILCIVVLFFAIYSFIKIRERQLRHEKEILEQKVVERTAEVVQQKEEIEEKNQEIMDSITYAKRLQDAILPPEQVVNQLLENSFILYKPKDIVSGDFYWLQQKGNRILLAAVDCTGHGVPGAFVSIVGYNGLNRAINEFDLIEPAHILDKLNDVVVETFSQNDDTSVKDGMDIALTAIDTDTNEFSYAGANNSLYLIRRKDAPVLKDGDTEIEVNSESEDGVLVLYEIKADKQPIGAFDERRNFTNHTFQMEPGDVIYLFSDGYADQFGGERGKKFKYKPFKQLLLSIYGESMDKQREILDQTMEDWKGDEYEQIDDICIFGVKHV